MPAPRQAFQEELAGLESQALAGLDMVVTALGRTMEALSQQDVELAGMIIADDDRLDGRYLEVHQGILSLLARQAPVATDLRLVAALLDVIRHVERMGDQCVNIAKTIPLTGHEPPVVPELLDTLLEMGRHVAAMIEQSKTAFSSRNVDLAQDLVSRDEAVNRMHRQCFRIALEAGDEVDTREWAMMMLGVGRALERMGDHTVDIGEQTAFIVTGLFREFTDASHPATIQ
jgi:phosphate transport system protein